MATHGSVPRDGFLFIVNGEPSHEPVSLTGNKWKKKPHYKSRRGCVACKRRKVKCDEGYPCSRCVKRQETCVHLPLESRKSATPPSAVIPSPSPSPPPQLKHRVANTEDPRTNFLYTELFHHFERNTRHTITNPEIWHQVLRWAVQEPYVMHNILCLSANHMCNLKPEVTQYTRASIDLTGKSASSFSRKLSGPFTAENSDALIATSMLMHYNLWINWEHINAGSDDLMEILAEDPLLKVSWGLLGVVLRALPVLHSKGSAILLACLHSPWVTLQEEIASLDVDFRCYMDSLLDIFDDPRYRPQRPTEEDRRSPSDLAMLSHDGGETDEEGYKFAPFQHVRGTLKRECATYQVSNITEKAALGPDADAMEEIAERLSTLLCLASISANNYPDPLRGFTLLIERAFGAFPICYGEQLRSLCLKGDNRALAVLYYFYRAARVALRAPSSWWAQHRSQRFESLIRQGLMEKGLQVPDLI